MPERPDFSLEGFMRGELPEIKKVYQWCYPAMIKRCMRFTRDEELSKDLLHNIFTVIISKGIRKDIVIESHRKLLAYLLTWMRNDTLNHIARQNGLEEFHRALSYIMKQSGQDIAPQIENEMFKRELWHVLEKIVNTLPPQCSLVYKMVKFEGMDRAEVAQKLNITMSTVNNHMHKAHHLIAERVRDY